MSWIDDLASDWGNDTFAACIPFCEAVADACLSTKGAILECGSGLTTLVIDEVAGMARPTFALEQDPEWHERVAGHVLSTLVIYAPLDGRWYDVGCIPNEVDDIGLVVCDGPCGDRSGLMQLRDRFRDDCLILMDDTKRPGELATLEKWRIQHGCGYSTSTTGRGMARVWFS